jgi:hypothetical protein
MRRQKDLTLRHHLADGRVRAPRLEKSAVREPDQGKLNPLAAEPEKSEAGEPDQGKQNPPAAVLNCRENHHGRPRNLNGKLQVQVKNPPKGHKRGLTGRQKGARLHHRRQRDPKSSKSNESKSA